MIKVMPCICFSVKEREIIHKYNFITYPDFLDNGFKQSSGMNWVKTKKLARKHKPKIIIAHDYCPHWDIDFLHEISEIVIIPVHTLDDKLLELSEWMGYPHDTGARDYGLLDFLEWAKDKKKWYLGFWAESNPEWLLRFDGFDSTLPETYSGKYGKIWKSWNVSYKPNPPMKTIEIFEINVRNFKEAVDGLQLQEQLIKYLT